LYLTVVYGSNWQHEREELWSLLVHINQPLHQWALEVVGDFNTSRLFDEKIGGKPLTFPELSPFNDCINACMLSDLQHVRSHWSWHNNSNGTTRIIGRLD